MSRFFFALWPDNLTREAIVNCRKPFSLSGQLTDQSKLHITLLFLGKLNINQQQQIIKQAEKIICPAFEVCLTHTGYFKKSKAIWLGLKATPDALSKLHEQLLYAAKKCHISTSQHTYKAHITLARNSASIGKQRVLPITWHIKNFVLVESIDPLPYANKGVKYQIIKYFS